MQKLLRILMVGMMFGQTNVSQKVINLSIDSGFIEGDNIKTLNELFPESNLEWALINIIGCSKPWCMISQSGSYGTSVHKLDSDSESEIYYYVNDYKTVEFINANAPFALQSNNSAFDIKLLITAEFPQEDTGYIEDGFDYCLHTGANLVSSPCRDEVAIESAIPSDILQNITGIITEGGAASNLGGMWVGSLNGLGGGKGYWVISGIDGCFNYTCSED